MAPDARQHHDQRPGQCHATGQLPQPELLTAAILFEQLGHPLLPVCTRIVAAGTARRADPESWHPCLDRGPVFSATARAGWAAGAARAGPQLRVHPLHPSPHLVDLDRECDDRGRGLLPRLIARHGLQCAPAPSSRCLTGPSRTRFFRRMCLSAALRASAHRLRVRLDGRLGHLTAVAIDADDRVLGETAGECRRTPGTAIGGRTSRTADWDWAGSPRARFARAIATQMAFNVRSNRSSSSASACRSACRGRPGRSAELPGDHPTKCATARARRTSSGTRPSPRTPRAGSCRSCSRRPARHRPGYVEPVDVARSRNPSTMVSTSSSRAAGSRRVGSSMAK